MNLAQALLHDDNLKTTGHIPKPNSRFSSRVADAIASEAQPVASNRKPFLGQSLAKMGIAASVALAFFLGMQLTFDQPNPGSSPVAQQSAESAVEPVNEVLLVESTPVEVNPEARQRLEDWIRSVSITPEVPAQLERLQDSPLYRLVNDIQNNQ
jgi:negative regulator of sigma E activity